MEPQIFLTVLMLLAKGCEVLAQRVDYIKQSTPTICATSYLQPANSGQFSVPAVIKPIIPEPTPVAPIVPNYPDYGNYPMPPIIITRDNDDDWHHLLYFLIFALAKNRGGNDCGYNNGYNGCGGNYCRGCGGYGCGGCGNGCGCGCGWGCGGPIPFDAAANQGGNNANSGGNDAKSDGNDSSNSANIVSNCGSNVIYVPYPIPIPSNCGFPCPSFPCPDNLPSLPDFYPSLGPALPPCDCDCKDEINFIIRTDCQSRK